VRINGLHLPKVWFGYVDYEGIGVLVRFGARSRSSPILYDPKCSRVPNDYSFLQVPLTGSIEFKIRGSVVDCSPARGIAIPPGIEHVMRAQPGARLHLAIRGAALKEQLAALLGYAPAKPLRFDPVVRLEERHGRSLAGILRRTALDFDADGVVNWLLFAQPNSYSDALRGRSRAIAPRDVRRATDYMHANLAQPITLSDLVSVSGVAGRTLLKHFRAVHGLSPMRYLRNLRMERVREELAAGSRDSVGSAALSWGFIHAGRFSIEYRHRFGESPSETLSTGRASACSRQR
jgi:AraC-like DNA-binding protein